MNLIAVIMPKRFWNNYGYAFASKYRRNIVIALHNNPKTPSQLSKELKFNISHISRALKELEVKEIVICLNPNIKKGRVYSLTDKGTEIAKILSRARDL